jgi:glycosyltransferase involved in cell wall biosynthesis
MKVAVYSICKNEEKLIGRWLETTADADLRVLVDTGSTDETLTRYYLYHPPVNADDIYTIVHKISINPFRFDDARNAALALVPADVDVCIALDIDEVLEPGWREALEAGWEPEGGTAQAWIDFNFNGENFRQNQRVHSRHGWRWKYPCHEGLYPNMSVVDHTYELEGFQITHLPDVTKPRPNYLGMLAWGEFENPNDARMLHYYGRELMFNGFHDHALERFQRYMDLPATFPYERQLTARYIDQCREAMK